MQLSEQDWSQTQEQCRSERGAQERAVLNASTPTRQQARPRPRAGGQPDRAIALNRPARVLQLDRDERELASEIETPNQTYSHHTMLDTG